jgi:DNA-binding GntR family transcriptional regulator
MAVEDTDRTESAVEFAINSIRDGIRRGRYAPGQRLVVAELAKQFNVSAGPVREAIRRLTGEGVVDIVPHKGAAVRTFARDEVAEIFRVREVIEGLAARLAAENIGLSDYRRRFQALLDEMRQIVAQREDGYVENNQAFHELIYEMASNRRLSETATQLTLPLYRLRYHQQMSRSYIGRSAEEHEKIAEAILAGDAAQAEEHMRAHIRASAAGMLASLSV